MKKETEKYYIRKKGNWTDGETKYVLEASLNGKERYLLTLPKAEDLYRLVKNSTLPSNSNEGEEKKPSETFALYSLSEHLEKPKVKEISPEEAFKLYALTK